MAQHIITSKDDLIAYIENGARAAADFKIGTEHEKFLYQRDNHQRVPYFGADGIGQLLQDMQQDIGWAPMMEGDNIIGLKGNNGDSITLEPGGQFELSGAPLQTIHETCQEASNHLDIMKKHCQNHNIRMFGLGHDPLWAPNDIEWMPKGRYKIMRDYMQKKGSRGTEMMSMTSTVQVNLDYSSEGDMVKKFRTSLALQPLATILFANSPFVQGKVTGNVSERALCWQDTDADRTGTPLCVFDAGFGYEQWVDYMLNVPMYFIYDKGEYLDVSGLDFKDYMQGDLPGHSGRMPTMQDWENHLTVAFSEVRLKSFLEMRGADVGPWSNICALPALWVGLLYDGEALDAAHDIIKKWSYDDVVALTREAPKQGFTTRINRHQAYDYCKEMVAIAEHGLQKRARLNMLNSDECGFLQPLQEVLARKQTLAEQAVEAYTKQYNKDIYAYIDNLSY